MSGVEREGMDGVLKAARDLVEREKFSEAISKCQEGLVLATANAQPAENDAAKVKLLLLRSSAYSGLSTWITSQSPSRSEAQPFYGQDPSHYALKAREDAATAVGLNPSSAEALLKLGDAAFLLEEFEAAKTAYQQGLNLDPESIELKEGILKVSSILEGSSRELASTRRSSGDGTGAQGNGVADDGTRASLGVAWDSDLECTLCMEMLYEPVTTPCGHSFCQGCFYRAMDHNNRCPMCRVVLHVGRKLPVTVSLKSILKRSFPDMYENRRAEEEKATQHLEENGPLPLFVMSLLMPFEKMGLNIFEPRYRLMVRRCMEGNRRFGMAKVDPETGALFPVAIQVEITECQAMPDGRYSIEVTGQRRFRMLNGATDQDGYRMAQPSFFGDQPLEEGSARDSEAKALHEEVHGLTEEFIRKIRSIVQASGGLRSAGLHQLLERANDKPQEAEGLEAFSFWAASLCVFSEEDRTALMVCTDTVQRLERARDSIRAIAERGDALSSCSVM